MPSHSKLHHEHKVGKMKLKHGVCKRCHVPKSKKSVSKLASRKFKRRPHAAARPSNTMDVDLLRPGTVPISPDTSLWFEFLLDATHLEKHLKNPFADPTPTDLIIKFLTLADIPPEPPTNETIDNGPKAKICRRGQALKILALQVAAHLKWDLELFETKLPLNLQAVLLKDFLNLVSTDLDDFTLCDNVEFNNLEPQVLFAIFLYHRWVLRAFANSMLNGKAKHNGIITVENNCEDISEDASERSVEILKKISNAKIDKNLLMPSMNSFTLLTEHDSEVSHKWNLGTEISLNQFHCQLHMDITSYLMFRESYTEAANTLQQCCTSFHAWQNEPPTEVSYCTVSLEMITGHCMAVGLSPAHYMPTLIQQFHSLFSKQYMTIEKVFEKDNLSLEIPQLYRDSIELDITSEIASGKITVYRDALVQIQASNLVRRALGGGSWQTPKVTPVSLQKALIPVISQATELERKWLKYLVGSTLVNGDLQTCRELVEMPFTKELLTDEEINSAIESDYSDPMPHVLTSDVEVNTIPTNKHWSPSLEIAALERIIITSYDPQDIKAAIVKILARNVGINVTIINKNWEIPIPIHNVIMNLPGGILHHYGIVLIAKAFELDKMKNFGQARALLRSYLDEITKECGNSQPVSKVNQFLTWEILLIDIHQFHAEWPAKHLDWSSLSQRCISLLHKVEGCLPRIALREECSLTLLNTGQWAALIAAPQIKHSVALADLYTAIASACEDINKYNKKISTDAWDKILPIFANNQKRRDGITSITQALCSIVELNALAIVISLLAKLHNVLIDQSQLNLFTQLTQLWPGSIKNANQYNVKYVSEMLMDILEHALKHYPYNVPWLKLLGDLHFANGHHTSSLKSYIEAAIAGTDYFSRPLHKNVIEDHIYKRMIKSCTVLQCHTQAGILCQFLDEIDYATAFKSLSESGCSDSMDSYYDCIWDVNILEFLINLHTKRGEHHRRQKVVRIIGLLELNSNNNDEIKREAENIRKGRFMRALAAQYLT